ESGRMLVTAFNNEGESMGIQFDIYEKFDTDRESTINSYRLPFTGEWFVLWGGADSFLNYHYPHKHQRYAYDFIKQVAGRPFSGNRDERLSQHADGEEGVARRADKVGHVISEVEDNAQHRMSMVAPDGNCIVLDHGYTEYTMLADLRDHS